MKSHQLYSTNSTKMKSYNRFIQINPFQTGSKTTSQQILNLTKQPHSNHNPIKCSRAPITEKKISIESDSVSMEEVSEACSQQHSSIIFVKMSSNLCIKYSMSSEEPALAVYWLQEVQERQMANILCAPREIAWNCSKNTVIKYSKNHNSNS